MNVIIYMNEQIRNAKPKGPVIDVIEKQGSMKRVTQTNEAALFVDGQYIGRVVYDPANNPSDTHCVKAWVEFNDSVEVVCKPA